MQPFTCRRVFIPHNDHLAMLLRHHLHVWRQLSKEAFTIDKDSKVVWKMQLASTSHKPVKFFKGLVGKSRIAPKTEKKMKLEIGICWNLQGWLLLLLMPAVPGSCIPGYATGWKFRKEFFFLGNKIYLFSCNSLSNSKLKATSNSNPPCW